MKRIVNKLLHLFLIHLCYPLKNIFYEFLYPDYILLTASVSPVSHNWGDDVSIRLVECINPNKKVLIKKYTWNIRRKENILCIGSIISWMTDTKSIIWGSGVVYPDQPIAAKPLKVYAVRGPLSRAYLLKNGIDCPEIYGDPALLFPRFYHPSETIKKYKIGLIPHFRDKKSKLLNRFKQFNDILIIDVQNVQNWKLFIDQINSCECVCSSSLHGIIVSDAYGIPNAWIEFDGGEKKRLAFYDYLESVKRKDKEPLILTENTSIENMIKRTNDWENIIIDLDKLMSVCPFK